MKKKRRRRKTAIAPIIILTLIILIMGTFGAYYYFFNNRRILTGSWKQKVTITDTVIGNMEDYLSEATFGKDIDPSEYVDDISIELTLRLNKDGSYEITLEDEDVDDCRAKACDALNEAMKELILKRLEISELSEGEDVDALIEETIGMSLSDYLNEYGPELLPETEELKLEYCESGSFTADRNYIYLTGGDSVSEPCSYLVSDSALAIIRNNRQYVYEREVTE